MIRSDRNQGLVEGVPLVFGADNHTYCVRHPMENLLTEAARLGIRQNASKDLLKEMFNRIAYATTLTEYDSAMDELRRFKRELAVWVEENGPQHRVQSKFKKERWGKLNNNPIESWNNWMRKLHVMSIPWLVLGHLQKVGLKWDKRKAECKSGRTMFVIELRRSSTRNSQMQIQLLMSNHTTGLVVSLLCN